MKLVFVAIAFVFFVGCMDYVNDPLLLQPPGLAPAIVEMIDVPEGAPEVPRLTAGGTLRLAMRAPATLNPLLNEDVTVARVLQLMFEPLISFDEDLRPVPNLAASLEFTFNGASVVVLIRDDALWSDGTAVTADDLIFSIETLQNAPEAAIYRRNVENFAYFEALDERSVRIHFRTINGGSAYMFNFPIIPRHHFANDLNNMAPMGNGPFRFEAYTPMESLELVRNMNTFRRLPNIVDVYVMLTPDAETDRHAFDRGLVDIYLAAVPEWARHHSVKPVHHAEYYAMHYDFIGFNFARALPSLLEFRQAIAHSLDVEGLIADVFLTHAMPARSAVHPASWLHEPDVLLYGYNIEIAQALAAQVQRDAQREGLWRVDEEGYELPLRILVNRENIEGRRIAQILSGQMRALGFEIELLELPVGDYTWNLLNGHFDLFVGGYNLSLQPDLRFAFHSESANNILSYKDFELDRLLEAAAVSGTDSQFYRMLSDIQIHMAQQLPVISLAFRHSALIADRRVAGDLRPMPGNVFANVEEWFIVG